MVHIKRLTCQGFKSFNRKLEVEMPFGLVCIAGSNGSGKSNVFDSIGFVLGELSSKTLRTENLSSLIYNGGHQGKPANRAKVEIVFDNSDKKISMDAEEVRVSREINKNGQGTYRINGQLATRTKIISLLDEVGIDPRGYSIVKQGQIAQIVDMSDKDRLTIISDISGISSYEERKEKAMGELEKVEKKLNDAKIILKEKENRLKEIEREKRQAERYNEMLNRIKTLKASFIHKEFKTIEEDANEIWNGIERMEERKKEVETELQKINELIQDINKQIQELDDEIQRKGGEDKTKLGEEIEKLRSERAETRANVLAAQREVKKIEERKKDLEKNSALNRQNITVLERERNKISKRIEEQERTLQKYHSSDMAKSQDKLFELQLKFNSISNDIINKKNKSAKIGRISEYVEKRKKLEKELEDSKKISQRIKQELSTKLDKESQTIGKIKNYRDNIEKLSKELNALEFKKNAYEKSLNYSVRRILEKKDELGGIHGTLESLFSTDQKYSLSIRVALGSRANNIVVENEDVAKKCVEFLRTNKIGVATFLPLNKIRGRDVQRYVNDKELVGYALDLIRFDSKYWNIFSQALFDTIIVHDFESAKRIGFGRNPMVTMQGDLISRDGSVSGGYRKKIEHQSDDINIQESVINLEADLANIRGALEELSIRKDELTNIIISMREERSGVDTRQATIEKELGELNEALKGTEEQDKLLKEIEKLESEKNKIGLEIERLAQISDSGKITEIEQAKEELNNMKVNLASYEAKLNNVLLPENENLQRVAKLNEEEKDKFVKEIKKSSKDLDEMDKKIEKKQEIYSKIDDSIKGLYTKKTRAQKKIERENKRSEEKYVKLREYDSKITARNIKLAEKNERKRNLEEQLKEFEGVEIIRLVNIEERKNELKEIEKEVIKSGPINQKSLEMYDSVKGEFDMINQKFEILDGERNDVLLMIDEIEKKKTTTFLKTYNAIAQNFKRVFQNLTGGEGHLDLTDTEKPLEGGIDIRVRTGEEKKLTHLRALSGGEKTITALAFIFAIQEHNPTPFYVMDEIDAALDKENSEKLARLIKEYSNQSQMIIISHNDSLIGVADYLYGVTMNKLGESTLLGVKLPEK